MTKNAPRVWIFEHQSTRDDFDLERNTRWKMREKQFFGNGGVRKCWDELKSRGRKKAITTRNRYLGRWQFRTRALHSLRCSRQSVNKGASPTKMAFLLHPPPQSNPGRGTRRQPGERRWLLLLLLLPSRRVASQFGGGDGWGGGGTRKTSNRDETHLSDYVLTSSTTFICLIRCR